MRQHLLVALAALACVLSSTAIVLQIARDRPPAALAQAASGIAAGNVVLATAVNTPASEAFVFVYDGTQQSIACYATRKQGLELRGVRKIEWDVQIHELPKPKVGDEHSVEAIRKELERQRQQAAQQQGTPPPATPPGPRQP